MYENLIKYPNKLEGATIKAMTSYRGHILLTLEDKRFGVLSASIAEEDSVYEEEVGFLKPGETHAFLMADAYAREFFKEHGCHDIEAIEKEVAEKRKEEERTREQRTIEREKTLLAELKAKYES